jgi:hypothetical protein
MLDFMHVHWSSAAVPKFFFFDFLTYRSKQKGRFKPDLRVVA